MEHEETLQTRAVVCNVSDLVEDLVNELLANSVVTTSVVVRGILLASDHQFWVEKAAVGAGADLVDDVWLEIAVDGTWDVLALTYSTISIMSTTRSFRSLARLPVSEKKVENP